MAPTKWGIVYGTANPHVRQHVLPDDDSHLDTYPVGPGEKLVKIPIVHGENNPTFVSRTYAAVCADAGVSQLMDVRFAEIDKNGNVIQVHFGDAALYSGPNTYVNCSPSITLGCTYNSSTGMFSTPSVTLPPKVGVRASAVVIASQIISAGLSNTPIYTTGSASVV